jgi:hypothetical protein
MKNHCNNTFQSLLNLITEKDFLLHDEVETYFKSGCDEEKNDFSCSHSKCKNNSSNGAVDRGEVKMHQGHN